MNIKSIAGFALSILTALGINFIPLEMWLSDDFSGAEAMVLYALENFVMLTLALILVRLLAPRYDDKVPKEYRSRKVLLQGFALVGYGFCLATSIFIAFFSFGILPEKASLPEVFAALKWIVVLQLVGFVIDLVFLRPMSLVGAERLIRKSLGRIMIVQFFGVFVGVFCAFLFGSFILPFIILKTLFEIGRVFEFFFGPRTDAEYLKYLDSIKVQSAVKNNRSKRARNFI
ncbi:MAG TPA: DUF6498-containing protein [Pyrinomonadaceae bacterium]